MNTRLEPEVLVFQTSFASIFVYILENECTVYVRIMSDVYALYHIQGLKWLVGDSWSVWGQNWGFTKLKWFLSLGQSEGLSMLQTKGSSNSISNLLSSGGIWRQFLLLSETAIW